MNDFTNKGILEVICLVRSLLAPFLFSSPSVACSGALENRNSNNSQHFLDANSLRWKLSELSPFIFQKVISTTVPGTNQLDNRKMFIIFWVHIIVKTCQGFFGSKICRPNISPANVCNWKLKLLSIRVSAQSQPLVVKIKSKLSISSGNSLKEWLEEGRS